MAAKKPRRTSGIRNSAAPTDLGHDIALHANTDKEIRKTSVHIADRVAAEHPHPLDDLMPRLAGRQLAAEPAVAAGVRELLAALGLPTKAGPK